MFNLDFNKVVVWLLPRIVRTVFNVVWLKALLQPIVGIYTGIDGFINYRNDVYYKLNHNGQVCYLEAALNENLDFIERRIFLTDAGGDVITLLHRDSDEEPLVLQDDATGAFVLHNDSAYYGGRYDFVVNIPYQFSEADIYQLRALVNYYKLAGKRYDIAIKTR